MENRKLMTPVLRTLSQYPDVNGLVDYLLPIHDASLGVICPESGTLIPEGLLDLIVNDAEKLCAGRTDTSPFRTFTGVCRTVFQAVLTNPGQAIPEEFAITRDPTKQPNIRNFTH